MATQILDYKKISELPSVNEIADDDVLVLNHNGISSVETATSTLATAVSEDNATINNIITAGFNLIGIDN